MSSDINTITSNLDNLGNSLQGFVKEEKKLGTSILHYMNDSGVMDLGIHNLNNVVEKSEEKSFTVWTFSSEEKTLTKKKVKKINGNDIVRTQLLGKNPDVTLWNLVNKSLTIINNYLFVNMETVSTFNPLDGYKEEDGQFTEIGLNALKDASSNDKKEHKPEQSDEEKAKLDKEKQDKWIENFVAKLDYLKSESLERGLDEEWVHFQQLRLMDKKTILSFQSMIKNEEKEAKKREEEAKKNETNEFPMVEDKSEEKKSA
tara:strand:- start:292 stop:1068 length:777 start_codon:yes stop_codon:yes gene_type:complete